MHAFTQSSLTEGSAVIVLNVTQTITPEENKPTVNKPNIPKRRNAGPRVCLGGFI